MAIVPVCNVNAIIGTFRVMVIFNLNVCAFLFAMLWEICIN